jgi:formate dehydrogenase iron-sulfur subunit
MAQAMGFMTDTTLCIGCKACEVACKEWNQLPAINGGANTLSGDSYDNTRRLDGENWRHVKFVEQFNILDPTRDGGRWLLMSDVCKHCVQAGCLEVCPTGAIIRSEFDTVVIQSDVCNGCRDCIAACPFDVIGINQATNTAMKCTLCYDRLQNGLTPACAQACPTSSIQFGPIAELQGRGRQRVEALHRAGEGRAYLYGVDGDGYTEEIGGLNSFFLLVDSPETYKLPPRPTLPSRSTTPGWLSGWGAALVAGVVGLLSFRQQRMSMVATVEPASARPAGYDGAAVLPNDGPAEGAPPAAAQHGQSQRHGRSRRRRR